MRYTVVFTPEAEEQIAELYHYIAQAASPDVAQRYTEAIVTYCEGLHTFPHRSHVRDDIRPGLRVTNYKGAMCDRLRRGRRYRFYHRCVLWGAGLRDAFAA